MEHKHAEENCQWVVEEDEEVEETALKGRQSRNHLKDNDITGEVVASSSSPSFSSPVDIEGGHRNGVCSLDPDGASILKDEEVAEKENISEIGDHCNDDRVENAAIGLGVAAQLVGAATNRVAVTNTTVSAALKNKNSVYFDQQEGSNGPSGVQNGDSAQSVFQTNYGEGEFSIQIKGSNNQNSLCNEVNNQCMKTVEDRDPSSSDLLPLHDLSEVQATNVKHLDNENSTIAFPDLIEDIDQRLRELDVEAVLEKQETHDLFCPNCKSCITKRVILKKRKRSIWNSNPKAKRDKFDTTVSSNLVDSSAYETKQGDHEITTSEVGRLDPPADDYNPEREPEVFRCLSCFSFFIPKRDGFKSFWNIGAACEHEISQSPSSMPVSNFQSPSVTPASNANWLFSLFTSNKGKTVIKQGDAAIEHSKTGPVEQNYSSSIASDMLTSPEIGHLEGPVADTTIIKNKKPIPDVKFGNGGPNSLTSSPVDSVKIESQTEKDFRSNMASGNESSSIQSCTQTAGNVMNGLQEVGKDFSAKEHILNGNVTNNVGEKKNDSVDIRKIDTVAKSVSGDMLPNHERDSASANETLVNTGVPTNYEWEPDFVVPSTVVSPILEKSTKDIDKTFDMATENNLVVQNTLVQGAQFPARSFCGVILPNDAAANIQNSGVDAKMSSEQDFTLVEKVKKDIEEEINPVVRKEKKGSDVIILVEAEAVKSTSQAVATSPVQGATLTGALTRTYIGEQPGAEIAEPHGWEILKAIIYGGLIESITSLGIVSSAVSAGAAPLNIIALGLANLIGGLFIIVHNLIQLKNDHSGDDAQQMNIQEDRYQELLGRRANFLLHAVIAVLSFLICGSVPLAIYGILISKNYYVEVEVAAVAATSLACIILLAAGKVYTKRPPKSYIKTILYYVTLALATSGVCYMVGGLIKELLEKFSQSESRFDITIPLSGTRRMKPAWTSY